jgi:RNA polymerase sigma-70 factor (ECF subfamily)
VTRVGDPQSPAPNDPVLELRAVLQRAVRRVCPRWLVDRSEDLVQVALMRVLDARGRNEGLSVLPSSYLYKVAYTTLIDEIRRLRRRPEVPLEAEGHGDGASAPVAAGNPEQDLAATEVGEAITQCLSGLGDDRRRAVTLHLQGHTVPQAAALLGWDAKRTENLVYRGLAELRQCLEAKGVKP